MTQPSNPGPGFVEALLRAAGPQRRQVAAVLRMWAGERVYLPRRAVPQGPTAADVARLLVFAGVTRAAAVENVKRRCGISTRHARRLVGVAVAIRGQAVSALSRNIGAIVTKE
jgi:hypothetical protein